MKAFNDRAECKKNAATEPALMRFVLHACLGAVDSAMCAQSSECSGKERIQDNNRMLKCTCSTPVHECRMHNIHIAART
jgi:hypothetical protein